jgi:hypothetical protein
VGLSDRISHLRSSALICGSKAVSRISFSAVKPCESVSIRVFGLIIDDSCFVGFVHEAGLVLCRAVISSIDDLLHVREVGAYHRLRRMVAIGYLVRIATTASLRRQGQKGGIGIGATGATQRRERKACQLVVTEKEAGVERSRTMQIRNIVWIIVCCILVTALGAKPKNDCKTIQSGELVDTKGNTIILGYDQWGYNYQAHMFNGFYGNYLRPDTPVTEGDKLEMKWNDAWLSNMSCDGDNLLDRHYGFASYIGSGAWLTNHQSGEYEEDGRTYKWNCFVKIVAVPADATLEALPEPWVDSDGSTYANMWYAADGTEIGPEIWGEFAIVQEVYNDQGTGDHGLYYKSPASPGFGTYAP